MKKEIILVVSPGGVGCTYLISQLNKAGILTNNIDDLDGLKHMSSPSSMLFVNNKPRIKKIIYLYNDPLLSVKSHFRRKWQKIQFEKINEKSELSNDFIDRMLSSEASFFNTVINHNKDLYGIERHFNAWYSLYAENSEEMIIVDFRSNTLKEDLSNFLGKEITLTIKERNCNYHGLDEKIVKIYSELDNRIKQKLQR